jgi:hypothetical protein
VVELGGTTEFGASVDEAVGTGLVDVGGRRERVAELGGRIGSFEVGGTIVPVEVDAGTESFEVGGEVGGIRVDVGA